MALRLAWLLAVIPTLVVLRERGDAALAGPSIAAQALAVGAGVALIVAAAVAPAGRIPRRGLLAAAGSAWLATEWANPGAPGALIFTAGLVATGLALALVLAASRAGRVAVALAVLGALLQGLVATLAGGAGMQGCFDCPHDLLALGSDPAPATRIGEWASLAACAAALATLPFALARSPRHERVLLAGVAAFAVATGAELAIALRDGLAAPGLRTAHLVAAAALLAIALATRARPLLLWRARRAVAAATTTVEGAVALLAPVVGDPSLALAYALPDGGWVDARGRSLELPTQGVTLIRDEGAAIAALLHDAAVAPDEVLVSEAAAAARLRLDAERLQAVVLARVEQLRDARRRVVEAAEDERRRLERDLHDGAQQRLVALRFALGIAQARAGGLPVAGRLGAADAALERGLAALRELAHGLYPPSLDADGLAVAVRGAAERARLAVAVGALPEHRLAPAVERAAYRVIVDALALAERAGARAASIDARADGGRLELRVVHDGGEARELGLLEDRVGALGGRLLVEPKRVVAELPCA